MQLVYFDRVQFKGMRVNRTYPTIIGWTVELARKKLREENKSEGFGKGKLIPRIEKPIAVVATSGVTQVLQKLASTVVEFGAVMADIGKQGAPIDVMMITFSGISNMLNVASTIEASTPTPSQLDSIFYSRETFTAVVDSLLTSLREYLVLGTSEIFWKVDELAEEVVDINWKETENYIDCGIFVMRHMETYKRALTKWNPGFKRKTSSNEDFLRELRAKYAATIIM
nr:uncharacterized protein LOC109158994 [Ipomoea batatas]